MLTTLGFVLSKKDVGEYDREYCFFTKNYGKIKLIAKSVRKPLSKLSGQLEPPSLMEIVFVPNNDKGLITTALVKKNYLKVRKILEKQKTYNTIVNTVESLTEYKQKDLLMWELLKNTIENLNNNNWKIIEIDFLAKFLKELGFSPNVEYCINCQKKIKNEVNIYFDSDRWGFCCDKCKPGKCEKISLQTFKSLSILLTLSLKEIFTRELDEPILAQYMNIKNLLLKYLKQIKKYF